MYDVIVIGARCGGSPTAMLLARKGYKVLLVDRATFPSDIAHGLLIHKHGPGILSRWGLLDRVVSTNCPPILSIISYYQDFTLVGRDLMDDGIAFAYAPRRTILDKILVDAAVEAGAELRQGFAVQEFATDGDRITGIRGQGRQGGSLVTEHASITIGADGKNSRLARAVRAPMYEVTPSLTCWYFSYWSNVPDSGFGMYIQRDKAIFTFPTNDDLLGIMVAWPAAEFPTVRSNIEGHFMAALNQVPGLAERVRNGRREERFCAATNVPNFFRKPYGPGWMLVGDAGCHKDPFLGLGIGDAFRDAELLAEAVDDGLSGRRPFDAAMADYERRRNEASMTDYHMNIRVAQFRPLTTELAQLRAALRGNQEATNQYFLACEGIIPHETFFNPQNLQRIIAAA